MGRAKAAAYDSHQNISGMPNEGITEYLQRRRVRPAVLSYLDEVLEMHSILIKRFGGGRKVCVT